MRTTPTALVAAGFILLTGCSSGHRTPAPARLVAIGTGGVGAAIQTEKPGTPYVFVLRALCTTGGPLRITSVRPYGASHMRVVAWGVRLRTPHRPFDPSAEKDGVPGLPTDNPGFAHRRVTVRCGTNPNKAVDDFAVGVEFTGTRGAMHGVVLGYGNGQSARSQFGLALCSTKTCARTV